MSLAWLVAFVTCSCPDGWYVATVRPSGVYACARVPRLGVCDEKRGCDDQRPDERVWLFAWCGDATPVNVDGRQVRCIALR